MKQTLRKTFALKALMLVAMLVGAITNAWADESTLNFTAACSGSGTASDGAVWTVTSDGDESVFDSTKGIHYGTGKAAVQYITLSTSDIPGTISKIVVNASGANGVTAALNVTVGGEAFGEQGQSITSSAAEYTFEGSAEGEIVVTLTKPESAVKALYVKSIVVTYASGEAGEQTFITIEDNRINNTNVFNGTDAGSLTAIVTTANGNYITEAVTWSGDNDAVATINASTGAVTLVAAGTVTFTASYAGVENQYKPSSKTYEMTVINKDPSAPGSEKNPYTVAQARAAIDAGTGVTGVYAKGIVSKIVTAFNPTYGNISYNISDDGSEETDQLQAYRGFDKDGAWFTTEDDIQVGDLVVIYGNLKKYNTTYEFDSGNQLVSLSRQELSDPGFSFGETTEFTVMLGQPFTEPTLTYAADFVGKVTYTSSNKDVADFGEDGLLVIKSVGTTTITASSEQTDYFKAGSASYTLTVIPAGALDSDFAFTTTGVQLEIGASQQLKYKTSSNGVITWESSNPEFVTVDENGVVSAVAIGEATITATQAETDNYKAGSAQMTVSVVKAQALETFEFDKMGYANAADVATVQGKVVTLTFDKGSNTSNGPKYYTSDTTVRLYAGNTLTVSSDVAITLIQFSFSSGSEASSLALSSEEGTYVDNIWTGSATVINFTSTGKPRITAIKVLYDADAQVKVKPGIAYEVTEFNVVPGEEFKAPQLINPNNLPVTYSSSNAEVASVDANSGQVQIGEKEGTATITASFAGDETYLKGSVSYTINVKAPEKLDAGLAYETTTFEVNVNGEFTAPELINPNKLNVKYSSSNEGLAQVGEDDGIVVIGSTAGSVTITASFAGDDTYKAGSASYIINIVDPNAQTTYYALVAEFNGLHYAVSTYDSSKKNYSATEVAAVNGKVVSAPSDDISWEIYKSTNFQCLKNKATAKYMGFAAGKTDVSEKGATSDEGAQWNYNEEEKIWTNSDGKRSFLYSGSLDCFKNYAVSNIDNGYSDYAHAYVFADGYYRDLEEGTVWGTICLPYAVKAEDLGGAEIFSIKGMTVDKDNNPASIVLEPEKEMAAGYPYVFKATSSKVVAAYTGEKTVYTMTKNGLYGTYQEETVAEGCYVLSGGTFKKCGANCKVAANRAWLSTRGNQVPIISESESENGVKLFFSDTATGISAVKAQQQGVAYDLTGRRVNAVKGGLYIVNGKKVIK